MTGAEHSAESTPGQALPSTDDAQQSAAVRYRVATRAVLILTASMLLFAALLAFWLIGLEGPIG